jgi:hypothetical protein
MRGSDRFGPRSPIASSLEDHMPYVRGHVRRDGFLGRRTWVRAHYRRNPRRYSTAYVLVAVAVIFFLIWLIFEH